MKDLKFEFKEYKIENDNFKMQAEKLDQDNQGLKKENGRLILQNQKQFSDTAEARKLLSQNQQELNTLMSKLQQDYDDLNIEYQKAANTEKIQREQLKENKQVLKVVKNKIIEIEGFVRDFQHFESQFNKENSKNLKLLETKDKEIRDLKNRNVTLEEQSGEFEKKYAQMNPLLSRKQQEQSEPQTKQQKAA